MNRHALTLVIVLVSAGCGSNKAPADQDVGIASQGMAFTASASPQAPAMHLAGAAVGAPQSPSRPGPGVPVDPVSYLAYAYGMSLELPGDRLIGVMDGHGGRAATRASACASWSGRGVMATPRTR